MLKVVNQKTFFGKVESCVVSEDNVIVLCFLCEKIRDNKDAKEVKMAFDIVPMAIVISPKSVSSTADFASLRTNDEISLVAKRWEDDDITYEVRNITLQQKYQDPAVYVGGKASDKLSSEPHSMNDRLIPANIPAKNPENVPRFGRDHMV